MVYLIDVLISQKLDVVKDFLQSLNYDPHFIQKYRLLLNRLRKLNKINQLSELIIRHRTKLFVNKIGTIYFEKNKTNQDWINQFPFMLNENGLDYHMREEIISILTGKIIQKILVEEAEENIANMNNMEVDGEYAED